MLKKNDWVLTPLDENWADSIHGILKGHGPHGLFSNWSIDQVVSHFSIGMAIGAVSKKTCLNAFILFLENPEEIEILQLGTGKNALRQKLMSGLLKELQLKNKKILLEVHESNLPARSLYEGLGFSQSGVRLNYYFNRNSAILYTYDTNPLAV